MKYVGENSLKKLLNLIKEKLSTKVDKVEGKDLSTNDYTNDEKTKLSGIEAEANKYTLPVAGEALGGVKSGTDITVDASGNVSVNDDSHNHVISNVDGLQTALDGKSATTHTHEYAGSDSAGGPANAVKDGVVTRAKLAADALYSPTSFQKNTTYSILSSDSGKTLTTYMNSNLAFTLTQEQSSAMSVGAEIAILRNGYSSEQTVTLAASDGVKFRITGATKVYSDATVQIADTFGMIAMKKLASDSAGDSWLITGNVEVVS